jgi:hypothetical protein
MNLAEAFSELTCTLGEAQILLTAFITNLRDSYPELHASMQTEIANMTDPAIEPSTSTSPTSSTSTTF